MIQLMEPQTRNPEGDIPVQASEVEEAESKSLQHTDDDQGVDAADGASDGDDHDSTGPAESERGEPSQPGEREETEESPEQESQDTAEQPQGPVMLRRSGRTRQPPKWQTSGDFIMAQQVVGPEWKRKIAFLSELNESGVVKMDQTTLSETVASILTQ
ncbi:hypothetical protein BaRGS_00001205 [Batillaria attramentaria]|uniref:Uncharacterized protein n=1 Tax=Batillaria attramentaria TaxID=370345 RepID=A0ABD0M702_9CAEN